jgi:integral membrane protein (TIGR01906 family)
MRTQIAKTLKVLIILLIPILVIGGAASLLATDRYLAFEYGKAGFPPDPFGFTQQQRFDLASSNIHYVRAHLPSDALANQTLGSGAVYNPREVSHMADVQAVFQSVLRAWWVTFILLLLVGFILWQKRERSALASAVRAGGLLTSGIIISIALLAVFAWQSWFSTFHLFFFEPGSWLFSYSDTLIRLFPVEFWFDATLTISILSLAGGLLLALIGWQGKRVLLEKQV